MASYFDLLVHAAMMAFMGGKDDDDRKDCWGRDKKNDGGGRTMFGIQSNLTQLSKGNVEIAVATFYAIEKAFLKPNGLKFISEKIDGWVKFFDPEMMDHAEKYGYLKTTLGEIRHLILSQNLGPNKNFNLMGDISEVDPTRLNIILSIEGSHGLQEKDSDDKPEKIVENFKLLKDGGTELWKRKYPDFEVGKLRFLYLTLTHMVPMGIASHANSLKGKAALGDLTQYYHEGIGLS